VVSSERRGPTRTRQVKHDDGEETSNGAVLVAWEGKHGVWGIGHV